MDWAQYFAQILSFCLHDNPREWELLFCLIFQMFSECKSLLKVRHLVINRVWTQPRSLGLQSA